MASRIITPTTAGATGARMARPPRSLLAVLVGLSVLPIATSLQMSTGLHMYTAVQQAQVFGTAAAPATPAPVQVFGGTFSSDDCDAEAGVETIAEQLSAELRQTELKTQEVATALKASIEAMLMREQELVAAIQVEEIKRVEHESEATVSMLKATIGAVARREGELAGRIEVATTPRFGWAPSWTWVKRQKQRA